MPESLKEVSEGTAKHIGIQPLARGVYCMEPAQMQAISEYEAIEPDCKMLQFLTALAHVKDNKQ